MHTYLVHMLKPETLYLIDSHGPRPQRVKLGHFSKDSKQQIQQLKTFAAFAGLR